MSRGIHVYGNWKMHKTRSSAKNYIDQFMGLVDANAAGIGFAVPFTQIEVVNIALGKSKIVVGAQNVSQHESGAYTGEISTQMLFDVGANFTLIGHSERRHVYGETDEMVHAKVRKAQEDALRVVLCVGETAEEREQGKTAEALERQLSAALNVSSCLGMIIAYEPVWAIGTGKVATRDIANEAHAVIRKFVAEKFTPDVAASMPILYGGSVKPENTKSLIEMPEIDGFLVGGASLAPEPFAEIVNIARNHSS